MKIIGLTGQSGTGKSTLAALAAQLGFAVLDCDALAAKAAKDPTVLKQLASRFGQDLLNSGVLNRRLLASRAFANSQQTDALNRIMFPAIIALLEQALQQAARQGAEFALLDAPTLYESGLDRRCSAVIAVLASEELRRQRLLRRDALTPAQLEDRLRAAKPDSYFKARTPYLLVNNGSMDEFATQAADLLNRLKNTL